MGRARIIQRIQRRAAIGIALTALGLGLAGCGGGGGGTTADTDFEPSKSTSTGTATGTGGTTPVTPAGTPVRTAQPARMEGRLLASNCFQCHGTMGSGGFDAIRGGKASEVLEYLTKPASRDIMAAHAQGYTREQLQMIITYLQQ